MLNYCIFISKRLTKNLFITWYVVCKKNHILQIRMLYKNWFVLIFSFIHLISFGQNLPAEVIVQQNCRLKNGIYLNFSQFAQNTPIPFSKLASDNNPENHSTLNDYLSQRNIFLIDSIGVTSKVSTSTIWGYCFHCSIYVNIGGIFYFLPRINSLTLVPEKIPDAWFRDKVEMLDESYRDDYSYFQTYENIEVIVDMRDGTLHRFERNEISTLIGSDSELANKYSSLSARKQKRRKLKYIKLFNQRNPLNLHKENTN